MSQLVTWDATPYRHRVGVRCQDPRIFLTVCGMPTAWDGLRSMFPADGAKRKCPVCAGALHPDTINAALLRVARLASGDVA